MAHEQDESIRSHKKGGSLRKTLLLAGLRKGYGNDTCLDDPSKTTRRDKDLVVYVDGVRACLRNAARHSCEEAIAS